MAHDITRDGNGVDPQFAAAGARMDFKLRFVGGADVQVTVERGYKFPPEVIARAQAIAAAN
jgi:hypothetical protein